MRGSTEQFLRKFDDGMRGLAALNGAGIAGVIGLMQRGGPIPFLFKGAGVCFLVGLFASLAMWMFVGIPENADDATGRGLTWLAGLFYTSIVLFAAGTLAAFVGAF